MFLLLYHKHAPHARVSRTFDKKRKENVNTETYDILYDMIYHFEKLLMYFKVSIFLRTYECITLYLLLHLAEHTHETCFNLLRISFAKNRGSIHLSNTRAKGNHF